MPICNDISHILGIKVKNLRITRELGLYFYKQSQCIFYEGDLTYKAKSCDLCGAQNENQTIIKHGSRKTSVYMGLVFERPAYLALKKQRFYCKACQRTYTAKTPYIRSRCRISTDVKLVITKKLAKVRSEKDIASDYFVSPSTVHRHLKYLGEEIKPNHKLPQYLSFDEFKSTNDVASAMSFIYCDAVNHDVIEILPDRRKFKLEEHFLKFSLEERKRVKAVTMDMYQPYMDLVEDLFPNAKIIIDRFHIVQAVNREINRCRVRVMNQFRTTEKRKYNKLKRYWKHLLISPIDLDPIYYKSYRLFDFSQSEHSLVQYLINLDDLLHETYKVGHQILDALRLNDINQLTYVLKNSKSKPISKGLQRVMNTLIKYLPYIEHTIDHPQLTNGPLEGINNKIKLIKRVSYGYRNFENFKARILIISRMFVSEYKKRTKQHNKVA